MIINQWSPNYNVYPLQVDRSCVSESEFPDFKTGYLRARFTMFSGQANLDSWIPPSRSETKTPIRIIANIIRAIDLPSGDDNGLSDPFVEVEHYGNSKITSICPKTLDPVWNQRVILDSFSIGSSLMPLLINVFDSDSDDPKKEKYEFLGKKVVPLPSELSNETSINVIPKPEWHQLEYSEKLKLGKIMISLQILPMTIKPENLLPLAFNKVKYHLKFKLLGLRNFAGSGIFPIKKPYVKINMAACKGELAASSVLDMMTANSKSGNADANFSEVIK